MTERVVLQACELSKVYRKLKKTVQALDGLNLSLYAGEVFGFLGPNGAGKSTTIKLLTGQIRPTAGYSTVLGQRSGSAASRRDLGYLPENPSFYDFLTGRELMKFVAGCFLHGKAEIDGAVGRALEMVGLETAADRALRTYSKGMVQRLGIAQTLVHDPELYIFDEPMSGLDPMGRALVKEIILDLKRRGKSIFFSTHITTDVELICDRLGIIVAGKLRVEERVDHLLEASSPKVEICLRDAVGNLQKELVLKGELQAKLHQAVTSGQEIEKIEPQRKSLEDYFLKVVDGAVRGDGL